MSTGRKSCGIKENDGGTNMNINRLNNLKPYSQKFSHKIFPIFPEVIEQCHISFCLKDRCGSCRPLISCFIYKCQVSMVHVIHSFVVCFDLGNQLKHR